MIWTNPYLGVHDVRMMEAPLVEATRSRPRSSSPLGRGRVTDRRCRQLSVGKDAIQIHGLPRRAGSFKLIAEFLQRHPLHRLLYDKEPGRSAGFVGATLLQLDQLAFEVGFLTGEVVTLGGVQLFELFLQHAALATEPLKYLGPLLLGYDDHARGTLTCLADDALMLSIDLDDQDIGLGDERVVAEEGQHAPEARQCFRL